MEDRINLWTKMAESWTFVQTTPAGTRQRPSWSRYFAPSRTQLGLGLVCRGVGWSSFGGQIVDRVLPYAGIVHVRAGSGWLDVECAGSDGPHRVDAPAAFYLPASVPHSYGPSRAGWEEEWALFDGPAVASYEDLSYLRPERPLRIPGDPLLLQRVFAELRQTAGSSRSSPEVELVPGLHELIIALGPQSDAVPETDAVVLARLRQLAFLPLPLSRLALDLGVSLYELRRIVHDRLGCSVKEYVDKTRIDTAQMFLANSRASVKQVALKTGYSDPAYFSRAFTKRVGMSPRAFRQLARSMGASESG